MTLVLRIPKGDKLTKAEMDNNLTYLEGLSQSKLGTGSFTAFTSSYTTGSFTGSFIGDGSGLTGISTINTGSFATTGSNVFVGSQTISGSVTISGSISQVGIGTNNTIIGRGAGSPTGTGINTLVGVEAGRDLTTGYRNTFFGAGAGQLTSGGDSNTYIGQSAGVGNTLGSSNIAVGRFAGARLLDGTTPATQLGTSIFIGNFTESDGDNVFNQIVIGDSAEGGGQNTVTLGNNNIVSTRLKGSVSASLFSGSFVGDGSGLTGIPSGPSINTGSFATTSSNAFVGAQVITGSLTISGSTTQSGSIDISGSINADGFELDITSTTNIPSLNSQFNLDLSGSATPFIYKTLVLNDGKVLVAGRFESIGGHTTNDIARLNSNGSVDTSFTATNIGGGFSATSQYINTFVTQSDGKIVIAGSFSSVQGSSRTGVAILNTNGTLDSGFSNPGFTTFSEVRDVVIQSDDKIVVVGRFDGGIKRLNTDGTIDASLSVPDSTGFTDNAFYSVALQTVSSTDYILVGGDFNQWNTSASYKRIARIGISGSLDTSFGGTNLDISSASGDVIRKIKVGAVDNNVYVAGKFLDTTGLNRHAGFARILTADDYGDGIGAFDRFFRTYIGVGATVYDFDFYSTDRILLGGDFSQIGFQSVQSANKFAIVNESNGSTVSNWFADLLSGVYNVGNNNVRSVLQIPSTSNVLIGGTFTTVNSTTRENLASLKLAGFGEVTTTSDYSITANSNQLLISSSNTYFSGDVNISASVTASIFTGSFVGDGSGLTGIPVIGTGSFATTGSNTFVGNQTISGSLLVTHRIESTGSLILQPNANDYINRFLEIYNTSPTDTHITASGGQIFIGDDTTYVKVDNYSNFNRIDIVANSGVYVSGLTEITGSLLVTGSANVNGFVVLPQVSASFNFADDTAAAGGGVPLGGLYHTSGSIKIRLA